jgi:hypothetical protein
MNFFLEDICRLKTIPVIKVRMTSSVTTSKAEISCQRSSYIVVGFKHIRHRIPKLTKLEHFLPIVIHGSARSHLRLRDSTLPKPQAIQSAAVAVQSFECVAVGVNRATNHTVDSLDKASAMMKRISAAYCS